LAATAKAYAICGLLSVLCAEFRHAKGVSPRRGR
jgi:hypothetical protein